MRDIFILLTDLASLGLSPDGAFTLYCINNNLEVPKPINLDQQKRVLYGTGFLSKDGKLTDKALDLGLFTISEEKREVDRAFSDFVSEYLACWDEAPSLLPSGKYAKSNKKDIEKKLKVFMNKYRASQETVLRATKKYLEKQRLDGYRYCRTAQFFISKDGESDLATEIEHLDDVGPSSADYGIKML